LEARRRWLARAGPVAVLARRRGRVTPAHRGGVVLGEAAAAERILTGAGFDDQAGESVLVQSPSVRVTDPPFRAVLASVRDHLTSLDNVEHVQSPLDPGGQGLIARDGHAALVSHVVPTTDTTASVILLVGMAVGVDYSLFYLRREREETAAGLPPRSALQRAAATSGQAVLISGATVVIAMAGMLLAGNAAFTSLGVGTILVVTMAVAGSLTVLPALLARLGHRVEWGRIRVPGGRRSRRGAGRRGRGGESRLWSAVLTRVLARPALAASAATIGLIALALPALGMRTQLSGIADLPRDLPVARAYARFQAAFPGSSAPATVVVKAADVTAPPVRAAVAELRRQAVASGEMAEPFEVKVNPDRTVAAVSVPLAGNGSDARSVHALETLRERVVPGTVGRLDGTTVAVTGETAGTSDFNHLMRQRAPLVFVFVLGLAFLLLLVTFRSLVVPAKAIVLNLLSVAASYGVLVAVFQRGWGASLLGTVDVKQAGVGLAVAVLLDATVVRAVLLPAAMALLGEWKWYLPRWLGWLPGAASARQLPRPIAEPVEPVPEPAGR
jgi:uncharacterized membrane protein YdfJ with MMPL/SSD domain